jgi:aminoglycoside 6'-N-acetyltransferase I
MNIRSVSSKDKSEWIRMRSSLWPECPEDHDVEVNRYFARVDEHMATFVCEGEDGKLRGFIEAGTRPYAEGCRSSPVGYIEGWWVEPEYRGKKLGSALVKAAEKWAGDLGLTEMASDADLDNELSHNAHQTLGYSEVGRQVCFRKFL